jgi:hypothetical protein
MGEPIGQVVVIEDEQQPSPQQPSASGCKRPKGRARAALFPEEIADIQELTAPFHVT